MTRRNRSVLLVVMGLACAVGGASCTDPVRDTDSEPTGTSVFQDSPVDTTDGVDGSAPDGPVDTVDVDPSKSAPASTTTLPPLPTVEVEVADSPGGFAQDQGLTGGFGRDVVMVTSVEDSGPGSYRDALSGGDRIVRFDPSLAGATISLLDDVLVGGSNLTLDGSGVDVVMTGSATKFTGTNIIVAGMTYRNMQRTNDTDALTFLDASETQVIGLYGNTFTAATDGLVDLIWNRGHDVYATICGNRFERHDKAMLVHSGRDEREGGLYYITLCNNTWSDIHQRTPLARDARIHQYNSVFERYGSANGDGGGSKVGDGGDHTHQLLENNVAIPRAEGELTWEGFDVTAPRAEWAGPQLSGDGYVKATGSLLETVGDVTATEVIQDPDLVFTPGYAYELAPATTQMRDAVLASAGRCVPTGDAHVVPCAPLLLREPGSTIVATVGGDVRSVSFQLDGQVLAPGTDLGGGRWELMLTNKHSTPGVLTVVVEAPDGRTVVSDPAVLAVIP